MSGVSSLWFREETINEIENAALHFIPEEYLSPFPRNASIAMIKDLSKRAGLVFESSIAERLAYECADFPFWIRKACSMLHRAIPVDERPVQVTTDIIREVISQFIEGEGGEIVGVAMRHLSRSHPRCFQSILKLRNNEEVPKTDLFTLHRYGLVTLMPGKKPEIKCRLIAEGINRAICEPCLIQTVRIDTSDKRSLILEDGEWAEELATLNRRRNILERTLRDFVRFALRFNSDTKTSWTQKVVAAITEDRRKVLSVFSPEELMKQLYLKDLDQVIKKYWGVFQSHFGDQSEFSKHMQVINERPDAHAKDADLADIALYRRSLEWFEKCVLK